MIKIIALTCMILAATAVKGQTHGDHVADYNFNPTYIEWTEGGFLADTIEFGWVLIYADGDFTHRCLHFTKIY